jgi:hypothetical protein
MDRRRFGTLGVLVLGLAGLVGAGVAAESSDSAPPVVAEVTAERAAAKRPNSCAEVLHAVRERTLAQVTAHGLGDGWRYERSVPDRRLPFASRAGGVAELSADEVAFSGTNLQEAGVDEPDTVKNDRHRAFTLQGRTVRAVRLGEGGRAIEADALELGVQVGGELLLAGDRLVVVAPSRDGDTKAITIDVSDLDDLEVTHSVDVEGELVSARRVGDAVRLIVHQAGPEFAFTGPTSAEPGAMEAALESNRIAVNETTLAEWLPLISVDDAAAVLPDCNDVHVPPTAAGVGSTSVVTLSADEGEVLDATSVLVQASEVYSTPDHLYVATSGWTPSANEAKTEIHRFDVSDPARTVYEATGSVRGQLLRPQGGAGGSVGQWSLSEHEGDLRVATTRQGPFVLDDVVRRGVVPQSDNAVTVLRRVGDALVVVGSVEGIGGGEQLYAVRYLGDTGFVVTFRQTDPLYVIDLSDSRAPRVTGELEVPGFSTYLHPIGAGRLLGVGRNANSEPEVSLFDVSDPAHPRRVAAVAVGPAWGQSGVESDARAFTWWDDPQRAVITVADSGASDGATGAVVIEPTGDGLRVVGHSRPRDWAGLCATGMRTRVVGDALLLFSPGGVRSSALSDLTPLSELDFAGEPDPGVHRYAGCFSRTFTTSLREG